MQLDGPTMGREARVLLGWLRTVIRYGQLSANDARRERGIVLRRCKRATRAHEPH